MTSTPEPSPDRTAIRFTGMGDYIAAIPALLGFYPERSIVLLGHDDATCQTGPTARFDLVLTPGGDLAPPCHTGIAEMVRLCKQQGAQRMFCVVVDDRPIDAALPAITDRLVKSLAAEGDDDWDADLVDLFVIRRIAVDERWTCAHGDAGRLPDPEINEATLARMLDGRPVQRSRSELVERLTEEGRGVTEADCRAAGRPRRGGGRR
ncbi:DUF4192 domain-containing protein, partial [Tsukamurella soli]|uniref:DUF4192 domain-containing protein n=1 Tax=Tsukamurella soli TaxID=644556 RepID=UPI0031F09E8A